MINMPIQSASENMNSEFSGFSSPLLSYKTGAKETIVGDRKEIVLSSIELPSTINETGVIKVRYCSRNDTGLEISLPLTTISLNNIDWENPVNTFQNQRVTTISEEYNEFCKLNPELVLVLKDQELEVADFMVIDLDTQQLTFIAPKVQE